MIKRTSKHKLKYVHYIKMQDQVNIGSKPIYLLYIFKRVNNSFGLAFTWQPSKRRMDAYNVMV